MMSNNKAHAGVSYARAPLSDKNEGATENNQDQNQPQTKKNTVQLSRTTLIALVLLIIILLLLACILPLIVYLLLYPPKCEQSTFDAAPIQSLRLPRSWRPQLYEVTIQTYMPAINTIIASQDLYTFVSNVSISMECVQPTRHVVLNTIQSSGHIYHNSILLTHVNTNENIQLLNVQYRPDYQQVVFNFSQILIPGESYKLYISYRGNISDTELNGFYRVNYTEADGQVKNIAVTQFQPTYARTVIPCFDEPGMKAAFEVTIIHPSALTSLSNTVVAHSAPIGNGWHKTIYEQTPVMSTYLLAIVICEFKYAESRTSSGTSFRVWSRPSNLEQCKYAAEAGKDILEYFEQYFGLHFPLEKQDMVAMPDFDAGAMENWGLILYRDFVLLTSNSSTNAKSKFRVTEIIAHELAHQWFGNLVTIKWWNDLWLNEGFATYLQYHGIHAALPTVYPLESFSVHTTQAAMSMDQMLSSHAIQFEAHNITEIHNLFDRITYDKGASIVRMMQHISSEQVLRDSLRSYLRNNQFSSGSMDALFNLITTGMIRQNIMETRLVPDEPLNLTQVIYCWVRISGYPVVTLNRDPDNQDKATLEQTRFLVGEGEAAKEHIPQSCSKGWYIPIWYRTQTSDKLVFKWMKPGETLQIKGLGSARWILMNDQARSFFRANYDEQNWAELINQLMDNHMTFDTNTRGQLIDDAFQLALSGKINYTVPLRLSLYLDAETHEAPWEAFLKSATHLDNLLNSHVEYPHYRKYLSGLVSRLLYRVQNDTKYTGDNSDMSDRYVRQTAWKFACRLDAEDCTSVALNTYRQMKVDCKNQSASTTGCNRHWLLGSIPESTPISVRPCIAQQQPKATTMIGCSSGVSLQHLIRLLNESLANKHIRNSEIGPLTAEMSRNPENRKIMLKFVMDNWSQLLKKYSEASSLSTMVASATSQISSQADIDELESFIKANRLGQTGKTFYAQLEQAKSSYGWVKRYSSDVINWCRLNTLLF